METQRRVDAAKAAALAQEKKFSLVGKAVEQAVASATGPVVGTGCAEQAAGPVTSPPVGTGSVVGPTDGPVLEQEDDSMMHMETGGAGEEEEDYKPSDEHLTEEECGEGDKLGDEMCEKCQEQDNREEIVICDGCDNAYHIYCVDPVLEEVPVEEVSCVRHLFITW